MDHERAAAKRHAFIDEIKARQRNIVWPDALVNSRAVDVFLWRGSSDAPLVQRIGAWLFGLLYLGFGVVLWSIARREKLLPLAVISAASFLLGAKIFLNGFLKKRRFGKDSRVPKSHDTTP
jgi:hypothetical protein